MVVFGFTAAAVVLSTHVNVNLWGYLYSLLSQWKNYLRQFTVTPQQRRTPSNLGWIDCQLSHDTTSPVVTCWYQFYTLVCALYGIYCVGNCAVWFLHVEETFLPLPVNTTSYFKRRLTVKRYTNWTKSKWQGNLMTHSHQNRCCTLWNYFQLTL